MEPGLPKSGRGLILGKFLPPHRGHQYLVDFALEYVDRLAVVVGALTNEPIPGALRYQWVKEMCPNAEVVHLAEDLPQYPHEHPQFWQIWYSALRRTAPFRPDYLFASEDYGFKLAALLGAEYVPVDHHRELMPVSGTAIRENPLKHWEFIPSVVRPHYVRRICVIGPESTGKSVLVRRLAEAYDTVFVSEYARGLIELRNNQVLAEDIPRIARGHLASESALARQANRFLFVDTDLIITMIYSEMFFGGCPRWVRDAADQKHYDLYLVTDADAPWVDDDQRFFPEERKAFMDRCLRELESRNRTYAIIGGSWEDRFRQAQSAVDRYRIEWEMGGSSPSS